MCPRKCGELKKFRGKDELVSHLKLNCDLAMVECIICESLFERKNSLLHAPLECKDNVWALLKGVKPGKKDEGRAHV